MTAPLKSYIDRVLNVLAEIDDLGTDKKEIYKELAADGYDRSVVSQVVGHLRKKAAKPGKFAEQSALFDLYLTEYEGTGTVVATHAARELPDHDADGVIIEDKAETPNEAALAPVAARQAEEEVRASSAANFEAAGELVALGLEAADHGTEGIGGGSADLSAGGDHESVADGLIGTSAGASVAALMIDDAMAAGPGSSREDGPEASISAVEAGARNSEPQPTAAQTGGPSSAPTSVAGPEAVESPAANSEPARREATAEGAPGASVGPSAGAEDRSGGPKPAAHDPAPVQLDRTKPAPWCADPEDCGVEASWNHTCGSCLRRRAQGDVMRAVQ